MELYWYLAEVKKVIDGDTLDISVDLGFNIYTNIRVRLFGLNTPETRSADIEEKKLGLVAKEYVKTWLDTRYYQVKVKTFKDKTEKYGRILAEIYDMSGVDCLNIDLLESNIAKPYHGEKR